MLHVRVFLIHTIHTHSLNPTSCLACKVIGLTQGEFSSLSSSAGLQIAIGCFFRETWPSKAVVAHLIPDRRLCSIKTQIRHSLYSPHTHTCKEKCQSCTSTFVCLQWQTLIRHYIKITCLVDPSPATKAALTSWCEHGTSGSVLWCLKLEHWWWILWFLCIVTWGLFESDFFSACPKDAWSNWDLGNLEAMLAPWAFFHI